MAVKPLIHGNARKYSLLAVLVSVLGWVIYIPFFSIASLDNYRVCNGQICNRVDGFFLPHWVFLVTGVFLYASAILHLVFNGRYYLQVVTQFLAAIFLMSGGAIIYTDWIIFYIPIEDVTYLFEFGACSLAVTALIISMLLWPFFKEIAGRMSTVVLTEPDGETELKTLSIKQLDNEQETDAHYTQEPVQININMGDQSQITETKTSSPIPTQAAPFPPRSPPHNSSTTQTSYTEEVLYHEPEIVQQPGAKKNVHFEETYDVIEQPTGVEGEYELDPESEEYVDVGDGEQTEHVMYEDPNDFRERSSSPEEQYEELP